MSHIFERLVELKQEVQSLKLQLEPDDHPIAADVETDIEATICRALAHHSSDMMAALSEDGIFRWVTPNAKNLFGWDTEDLLGASIVDFIHPEDLATVPWNDDEALRSPTVYRLRMGNGLYHWVETRNLSLGAGDVSVVATRDINSHYMAQTRASQISTLFADELERMAHTDSLTLLPNRRSLEDLLGRELSRSARTGTPISVVFFDVDRFKAINDTFGHLRGDKVLKAVGQRMANALRPYDFIGRWGGDEFLVVLPDTDADHAVAAARRLADHLIQEHVDEVGTVTVSGGVAQYAGETEELLVDRADRALYRAKIVGRNCVERN
jgi:diguanylate cyclase (GGDEF)-like protein/PAS domain S-box-containing protein